MFTLTMESLQFDDLKLFIPIMITCTVLFGYCELLSQSSISPWICIHISYRIENLSFPVSSRYRISTRGQLGYNGAIYEVSILIFM